MASSLLTSLPATVEADSTDSTPWVADQGDGTYRNPVLHADYSDPDVVRVGDDYWMTSSSFNHVPGLPILHSRDLVNWTLVNHALTRQVPDEHFTTPRHGEGVWAPSIRYHAGLFWIFYPDPDFGLYVITATDPRGEWSKPHQIKAGRGLIDPCPLWAEDGRAWLVHGWAKSRAGVKNRLTVHEMSPDGSRLLDDGQVVIDGDLMPGWITIEGPKFYQRDGWYYIFAPAGGVREGYQAVFRSRDVLGPYEDRVVLAQGTTPVNGPHQGAWVTTASGQDWFFHFQEMPAHGRVVHLQPMRWREDGWPVMGDDPEDSGTGQPFMVHPKPALPLQPVSVPPTSDAFAYGLPGLQWQWQGNPGADWIILSASAQPGLRLRAVPSSGSVAPFWQATHLLMQKFPGPEFSAEVTLTDAELQSGDHAGLVVFGYDYSWVGLRRAAAGGWELVQAHCVRADKGGQEKVVARMNWPQGQAVRLRVSVAADRTCRFSYRALDASDAEGFTEFGQSFVASSSRWVGAKVGIYCQAAAQGTDGHAGFADFVINK